VVCYYAKEKDLPYQLRGAFPLAVFVPEVISGSVTKPSLTWLGTCPTP